MPPRNPEAGALQLPFEDAITGIPNALDTAARLEVLLADRRAAFLPQTHREKNEALVLLDYIDNPKFPGGVHDHLAEVFDKQKKNARMHGHKTGYGTVIANISVQSILYEYADYWRAMASSEHELGILGMRIEDCPNPSITLEELASDYGDDDTGVRELVQTIDVASVKTGSGSLSFDPLLTQEVRLPSSVRGKNKIVKNRYMPPTSSDIEEHVRSMKDTMRVGEVRSVVVASQRNAANGKNFWRKVLQSRYYEFQGKADNALATTESSL